MGLTLADEKTYCEICKKELVWHEGVYAGYVHSNNFSENQQLSILCQEIADAS